MPSDSSDMERACGIGLERESAAAENEFECLVAEKMGDHGQNKLMSLIREHGAMNAVLPQGGKRLGNTLVGLGPAGPSFAVEFAHGGEAFGNDHLVASVGREHMGCEHFQPHADKTAIPVGWPSGKPEASEGAIHGVGDVVERIEKRAVEIENRGLEVHGERFSG